MASEQPAFSDAATPSIFMHPTELAPPDPIDLSDIPEHPHGPRLMSRPVPLPFVPQLQGIMDMPNAMGLTHLPPMPFSIHDAQWRGDGVSELQRSSHSNYPSIIPIFVDSSGTTPIYSSGPHDPESDQNWDPINMILKTYGDNFYDGSGLSLEGQGQDEQHD